MNLNIERVLRFVTVAEHLSYTRAAAALNIDQPWLSRQVMQLEDQLGFMLFCRTGSRISLTPEGQAFYQAAQELCELVEKVRRTAEDIGRHNQATLRIGVAYATYPLEGRRRLLDTFGALRPNVGVEFSAYELSDDVEDKVESGDLDFGIAFSPIFATDLEVHVLQSLELTLAAPQEDPLARAKSIALSDLAGRRVAVGMKDPMSPRYLNAYHWIDDVGATARIIMEGRRFLPSVADKERLFYVCYTPADTVMPSFVRCAIHGYRPTVNLCLFRGKRVMSTAGERLWRLAEEMAVEVGPGSRSKARAGSS
jgi:DNA-binding transcriptional LysR family regulator